MKNALASTMTTLPEQLRRSLTWDRGKEMSAHAQFKVETGIPVFFADPHSPWQRGTNENTNGLLRQYFPKGTDLSRWNAEELEAVASTRSTADPARPSAGRPLPKPSTNTYSHSNKPVLRRPIEPGQYTLDRLHRAPRGGRHRGLGRRRRRQSYDNALAESIIGLYKTELIKPRGPWKGLDDLEIATAEWVDWFNHRRPFEYCDDLTPAEAEQAHYRHHQTPATAAVSSQ